MYNPQLRVHLIDTPGFDDTNRSDVEVLQDISAWLSTSFAKGTKLNGIIFLHRISDPRMTGSARRNLLMFKKLCGANAYKSVVLATTMWSKVNSAEGDERERQLKEKPDFWGTMHAKGSHIFRYTNTIDSAEEIINYILSLDKKVVLNIQDELVNRKMEIQDTSAAVELNAEIIRERRKHQEELAAMKEQMQEAIETRDRELQEIFQEEIGELQGKIEKGVQEQRKLTQSLEEVQRRKEAEFEAFKEQIRRDQEEAHQRYRRELEEQRRIAKEQEASLKKSYDAEVRRLAEEQEIRVKREQKREEEFRIQQQEAERRRAAADEKTQRELERQRQVAAQAQQEAMERHRRETELYHEERERRERRYLADKEEQQRNYEARQREIREEDMRRQKQFEESLQRKGKYISFYSPTLPVATDG
jgi:hypothetical protein